MFLYGRQEIKNKVLYIDTALITVVALIGILAQNVFSTGMVALADRINLFFYSRSGCSGSWFINKVTFERMTEAVAGHIKSTSGAR